MRKIYTALTILLFSASAFALETEFISAEAQQATPTIETFSINDVEGAIDAEAKTVFVELAAGTDVTALQPEFTLSEGAVAAIGQVTQTTGVSTVDFTDAVVYTVSNETESVDWTVTVTPKVVMTFNVNMISKDVGENEVYVTGSFAGWPAPGDAGAIVLTDDDGDHIYTATAEVPGKDSVKYKYFVGTGWGDDDPVGDRIVVTNGVDLTVDDVWNNDTEPYVAVDENALSLVSMYPNPVNSTLTIANLDGAKEIIVSNVLGKTMLVKPVDGVEMTINTSELRTGIYVVTIVGQNSTRSERIIKQ